MALRSKQISSGYFGAGLLLPILLLVGGVVARAHADDRAAAVATQESGGRPVVLISRMRAKPGKQPELEVALREFYERVRLEEPGCLINIMHTVSAPPRPSGPAAEPPGKTAGDLAFSAAPPVAGELVFYEVYRDPAAAAAHTRTPHFLRLKERLKELVEGPIQLEFLAEIAGVRTPY